ncbi:hypothetical protein EDD16DRAFT_1736785 [Pisolithus croceorrhizus]|nr:hypothetical protein EV401DRAFT_2127689 [Pisolithus croceorrhizus]KAI6109261.1 hypothetical protein EDD16DRAFT_1736785 [Pisolithus croceorrhizus]KAI6145711.1 hypothetical protein EDD17DRAFT_1790838 [Pisolithus thermaeus]
MRRGDLYSERDQNPYFPFADRDEWELGKFLYTHHTQTEINTFLKLRLVTSKSQLSFRSAQELLSHLDAIPKGPTWHCTKIDTTGYVTKDPVYFFWRNALEVTREIFGNPVFARHMEYDPYEVYEGTEREYGEWMSGDEVHRIQDQLPAGATIVPIILALDKAPVTQMTGDIEMHPLFLTIANINSKVRMKATSHAWACIAYTPTLDFITNSEFHSVLEARVWHRCVDIVCTGLKLAARTGTFMSDPNNATRYCFTPLAAYTADLPEQLMISCVDPWKLQVFLPEAKKQKLSGELLHFGHKMFFDHPFKWCKELLGHDEIDTRYRIQHKRIGTRHFNGVSQVNQMTGHEHRDLQRTIVATIAGLAEPDFVYAIRAIVDFLYRAQAPTFMSSAIHAMEESLREFHMHKDSILRAGVWRGKSKEIGHFQIPKLELLQSFGRSIRNVGSLIQYSADVSERLLITHCKDPFTRTNRQRNSFTEQIVLRLDREESIRRFDLYSLLLERDANLTNMLCSESNVSSYVDLTADWLQHVAPEEVSHFHGPRTFRNHFLKGIVSDDSTTAFHITVKPDYADKSSNYLATTYNLPDFPLLLWNYIDGIPGDHRCLGGRLLKGWTKFRLQLRSHHRPSNIIPSQQVQALPPSTEHPLGKCDAVLVHYTPPSGTATVVVAQVRAIFAFSTRGSPLPTGFSDPLLYVQYFAFTATPIDQPDVAMYTVERMFNDGPEGSRTRVGAIVPLLDVIHAVELIPNYGVAANREVTSQTCQEVYDKFFLNNFTDKEWYYTMYHDYQ